MSNKVDLIMSRLLIKGAVKVKMNPASGARSLLLFVNEKYPMRDAMMLMDGVRVPFRKVSDLRNALEKNAFYIEGWK